jgi:hypothetical protein
VFKVAGRATDDVWMSCGDGSVLHWQGRTLEREPTGVVAPLFSIATTAEDVVAVGGQPGAGEGKIVEHATAWTSSTLSVPVAWRGTAARDSTVVAVGERGVVAKREAGAWGTVDATLTQTNLHGAWIDPDGGLWVAGGDFERVPLTTGGFVAYQGTHSISEVQP